MPKNAGTKVEFISKSSRGGDEWANRPILLMKAIERLKTAVRFAEPAEQLSQLYLQVIKNCFIFIELSSEEFCKLAGLNKSYERDFNNLMLITPQLLMAGLQNNFLK